MQQYSGGRSDSSHQSEGLGNMAEQALQEVGRLTEGAREQGFSWLDQQKVQASSTLESAGKAIEDMGRMLREQGQPQMAGYAEMAANQVCQLSSTLRDKDIQELYVEAEGFARRQPAVFLGGALVLGFLAARFLKSSALGSMNGGGGQYSTGSTGWSPSRMASNYGTPAPAQPSTSMSRPWESGTGSSSGSSPTPVGAASRSAGGQDDGLRQAEPNGRRDPSNAPGSYPGYGSGGSGGTTPVD